MARDERPVSGGHDRGCGDGRRPRSGTRRGAPASTVVLDGDAATVAAQHRLGRRTSRSRRAPRTAGPARAGRASRMVWNSSVSISLSVGGVGRIPALERDRGVACDAAAGRVARAGSKVACVDVVRDEPLAARRVDDGLDVVRHRLPRTRAASTSSSGVTTGIPSIAVMSRSVEASLLVHDEAGSHGSLPPLARDLDEVARPPGQLVELGAGSGATTTAPSPAAQHAARSSPRHVAGAPGIR